ncbi:MAG: GTPase [Candidatus Lokiarchaeota archaeon]|nr:GTPase [Candidatus Lokiarchaeota archaeon]
MKIEITVQNMFFIFVIGTAGSGKSALTAAFEKWLATSELGVTVVNLDPGVEDPPYTSDVDIREYVDYGQIMHEFGLGPNGALVAALDMAISHIDDLKEEIIDYGRNYVLIDCPGQMELFAYRNSGPLLISSLKGNNPALSLYLLDANIVRTPPGYLSSMLLGISINIRFSLPQIGILSKSDLLSEEKVNEIISWSTQPFILQDALDITAEGMLKEYSSSILRVLEDIGSGSSVLPISSRQMEGMEILYGEIQRILAGGENYQTYE